MKKSRFTESKIMAFLKQNESGISVPDLCREHGTSSASFYKWRSKYSGMNTSLIKRMKELEEENQRLKKMYAEEKLKAEIADWLLRLTTANKRWGFGLCFMFLRNSKGFKWNHKRVYRIYRELELNLFEDIEQAQILATQWQWTYNNYRSHSAIGGIPPRQLCN